MANRIKNMGTSTVQFKEGAIVSGSLYDNDTSLVVSGSIKVGLGTDDYTLPIADGSSNQVIKTDGNGNLSWTNQSGGGGSTNSITDADNNTKVQVEESSDENKIRFDTAGTERMIITNTGAVGIGTSAPDNTLHVKSPGTTHIKIESEAGSESALKLSQSGQSSAYVWMPGSTSDLRLYVGGADRVHIDNNGKIGIGTTDPSELLTLNGTEPTILFEEGGTDMATIGVNSSDNILIENKTMNKHIVFKVNDQGVVKEGFRLDGAVPEVVVNQTSESLVDFRVESDNNTHMLFVDGSADKVGINTSTPACELDVNGIVKATSLRTGLIEYTDGDDAITIEDGGYIKLHSGVKYSRGVKVSSANSADTSNAWIKIATSTDGSRTADTCASTFLVTFAGHETSNTRQQDGVFLVTVKATYASSDMSAIGTWVVVEPLKADHLSSNESSDFNPATDIFITHDGSVDTNIELYIKSPAKDKDCFVTHLGGSGTVASQDVDPGFVIHSGQSWAGSEPVGLGNKVFGGWASKIFSKLGIVTNSPIAELDVAGKIAITAESSTPSQPADGQGYLYTKSDGKVYWRSYDIAEVDLTAAATAGNKFQTIAVSGQSSVVADASDDTLTLVAGSNVTLTTNAGNDEITIATSGGSGGKVLQVVHFPFTGIMSSTSQSFVNITDGSATLQASITPSSNQSKILIQVELNAQVQKDHSMVFHLWNGSSTVGGGVLQGSPSNRQAGILFQHWNYDFDPQMYSPLGFSAVVEDSPNTTNQITYTVRGASGGGAGTFYINQNIYSLLDALEHSRVVSSITLMEIGA